MQLLRKYQESLLFGFLGVAFLIIFLYLKKTPALVDEHDGYRQVLKFSAFNWVLLKISAMPTYYFVLAMLSNLIGNDTVGAIRALSLCFSFLSVFVFYLNAKLLSPQWSLLKTLQFAFLPILNIFFFLIYTEPFSLLFILLSLHFTLKKKYALAGLFGIIATGIRQNNVMWMMFMVAYSYVEQNGLAFSLDLIKAHLKKCRMFLAGFFLFAVFVILNGGVAIGDAKMHPGNISIGNIVFVLFTFFVVFFPLVIAKTPGIFRTFIRDRIFLLLTVVCFAVFYVGFNNDHPYNLIDHHYFVRNYLLNVFFSGWGLKIIFFLITVYSIQVLKLVELKRSEMILFYVFTLLFLLPSWLIDVRYYVIPFSLFLLFKKERSIPLEIITVVYFLLLDAWIIKMARTVTMFL